MTPRDRYIELLKSSLLNELYLENEVRLFYIFLMLSTKQAIDPEAVREIGQKLPDMVKKVKEARQEGKPWWRISVGDSRKKLNLRNFCEFSHTMIGRKRLDNIHHCLDVVRQDNIAGDLAETGVWRGGATIFMRGYLAAWEMTNRTVWVADSFEGLPVPSMEQDKDYDYSASVIPILAISLETVQENFRRYDLLDEQVRFLKGWFNDTLPTAPIEQLSILRLDGDLYESTMDGLNALYHKVSPGGFVIVDDYGDFEPCRRAIDEFREQHGITEAMEEIDWSGVYWRKLT